MRICVTPTVNFNYEYNQTYVRIDDGLYMYLDNLFNRITILVNNGTFDQNVKWYLYLVKIFIIFLTIKSVKNETVNI